MEMNSPARTREDRVYRAIMSHAVPFVAYTALIGLGFGVMFGIVASLSVFYALDIPMILLYAMIGFFIGAVVAIRKVCCEMLTIPCSGKGPRE